jgi:hypothetical protein
MAEAEGRRVKGGAVFDFLHHMAARKAKDAKFYTLNTVHFLTFQMPHLHLFGKAACGKVTRSFGSVATN